MIAHRPAAASSGPALAPAPRETVRWPISILPKSQAASELLAGQGMDGIVTVRPSPIYGWEARVTATPSQVVAPIATVEQIAAELRERYSLKSK
jgi:hypothetical protein